MKDIIKEKFSKKNNNNNNISQIKLSMRSEETFNQKADILVTIHRINS